MIEKQYINFEQMKGHCNEILRQMADDNWHPEIILGITRGGALPAVMLSQYLNVKMIGLDVSLRDTIEDGFGQESNELVATDAAYGKKVLIVDDINDTGATINWIIDDWNKASAHIKWGENVRFAVVVDNESSKSIHVPEYAGEMINKAEKDVWIVFPYEDWWK
jgi:hypoxanthine phosphoribosyltransferase